MPLKIIDIFIIVILLHISAIDERHITSMSVMSNDNLVLRGCSDFSGILIQGESLNRPG